MIKRSAVIALLLFCAQAKAAETCKNQELNKAGAVCIYPWGAHQLIIRNSGLDNETKLPNFKVSFFSDEKEMPLLVENSLPKSSVGFDKTDPYVLKAFVDVAPNAQKLFTSKGWGRPSVAYVVQKDVLKIAEVTQFHCFSSPETLYEAKPDAETY